VAEYLKRAAAAPAAASEEVARTVAGMLADIERRGEDAVREWSRTLDG
jgi:sulfopropanediol 3-dehydrogenase